MKRNSRSAFTFIELLIVACIIVVLMTILLPVFSKVREHARRAQCQSNLQQIGVALQVYAHDNFGKFPPKDNQLGPLHPYLHDLSIFACPTDFGVQVTLRNGKLTAQSYRYKGGLGADDDPMVAIVSDPQSINHNGGRNVLFLDGHVKFLRPSVIPPLGQPIKPKQTSGFTNTPPLPPMGGGQ